MNETTAKKKYLFAAWFRLCPVRHILSAAGLLAIAGYFALRRNHALMSYLSEAYVHPWHSYWSWLLSPLPFSAAELLITLGVISVLIYIIFFIIRLFRKPEKQKRIYRFFMTCLTAFALIYGGFCLLWGVYYYTSNFQEISGIEDAPISTEQLETVTRWFTALVNEYGTQVSRDESGVFNEDLDAIFDRSAALYDALVQDYPWLMGKQIEAKPFFFSRCMSYVNFTGFFFPFTGEAIINVDSPACLIPSTIAHELAHQRGVAQEDEANFAAVLACLENGDPVYCYSACLLAYIHLGNALYQADYEAWEDNYRLLSDGVRADLAANNEYWKQFETPISTVSDTVYTGFLQSYGQELGLKTYGACVDLLATYYYETALEALK